MPARRYTLVATGKEFGGWRVVGAPGNVGPLHTEFAQGGFNFHAHGGQISVDLTGTSNTATGIEQTVATTPGTEYCLSYWVGNVVHPNGMFGTTSSIRVLVDGRPLQRATNADGAGSRDLSWKQFTVSFTAAQASTTVTFLNDDPNADTSNFIDDVTLN